jgi:hypothetical protein
VRALVITESHQHNQSNLLILCHYEVPGIVRITSLPTVIIFSALISLTTLTSAWCQENGSTSSPMQKANQIFLPNLTLNEQGKPAFWSWSGEQEWIVDTIGKDIAEMLVYAKFHNDSSVKVSASALKFQTTTVDQKANKYRFDLVLPSTQQPITHEFVLEHFAWSPADYKPFAQKLMGALNLQPDTVSKAPDDFYKILANAEMSDLFAQNERISEALSAKPLDAGLHEQAALEQAVFDMLELAGNFCDTRSPLNRICAHLSIAEALEGNDNLTLPGKIAEIALESMSCRDAVSVTKNDDLAKSQTDETLKSILRALKIRSTFDYRLFDEKNQTQLEASQFGMRYGNLQSANKTLSYIESHKCTPKVRWMRIACCGGSSVETGHIVDSQLLPAELQDFADDYKIFNKSPIEQGKLITELNKISTRCLRNDKGNTRLVVLSWDDVAACHARHVINAIYLAHDFYEHRYGVKEMADKVVESATKTLGDMTLFPLSLMDIDDTPEHQEIKQRFFAGIEKLALEHPEQIPAYPWIRSSAIATWSKPSVVLQLQPELWFEPPYPAGTAYYFIHRLALSTCKPDLNELTRLRALCPFDEGLCWQWITKKYGENPTGAQLREGYGKLIDYDIHVMHYCAEGDWNDPQKYEAVVEKIAEFSPAHYLVLGGYCAQHNEPEKAKKYYSLGLEKGEDAVGVANGSAWLTNYLYDNGEKSKALEIAKSAAEVYSHSGLTCLGDLYDRMGELTKAEETYKAINERYDSDGDLVGFYLRNASKSKHFSDEAARLVKVDFPNGLQRLDSSKLAGPPKHGVTINSAERYPESLGLKEKCVIVGLNGYKVDNKKQYFAVRCMTLDPNIKATFWNGKQYKDVVVQTLNNHLLQVSIEDLN